MRTSFRTSVKAASLPSQKKANEVLREGLGKGGVDFGKLEQLHHQSVAELKVEAKRTLAEAKKHSKTLSDAFRLDQKNLQARLSGISNAAPDAQLFLIDTATGISAVGMSLSSTNLASQNNWAQFEFGTTDSGSATVDFQYQWTNPTGKFAVVNVVGFIAFNGMVIASTDGSFWPFDHQSSHIVIDANLRVSGQGIVAQSGDLFAYGLNADSGGGWSGNPGVYETGSVFRGLPPDLPVFTVAPRETIQIDVLGEFNSSIDSGYAGYIFQDDGRQVTSAAVIVSITS
jgi:hypothetical protein